MRLIVSEVLAVGDEIQKEDRAGKMQTGRPDRFIRCEYPYMLND